MISGSTDVRQLAQNFLQADRASRDKQFNAQMSFFDMKIKAYTGISEKVTELQTLIEDMSAQDTFESYAVTQSQEGFASITAGNNVVPGEYKIHVDQLASSHQYSVDFASETDPVPTSGNITLGVGGDTFNIDMSTLPAGATLLELRDAINEDPNNTGVQASVVRAADGVKLILSSEESGAANTLSMTTDGDPALAGIQAAFDAKTEISAAQDARIFMGENNSIELTSSTNTFDNAIDGLTIDVEKVHTDPTEQLIFEVGQDPEATEERLTEFVDKFNEVMSAIDKSRGDRLGGDISTRMISNQLKKEIADFNVGQFGIELTQGGKLEIDSTKLKEFLENDPDGLTTIFGGDTGLLKTLEGRIDTYVGDKEDMLPSAKQSIESSREKLQDRMDRFDDQMEQKLNRYIQQFSAMQSTIMKMEQSMGLFG